MFRTIPLIAATLSILVTSSFGFIEFDEENGVIIVHNTFGVYYDSNIAYSTEGKSDIVMTYEPVAEFRRSAGLIHLSARIGGQFEWFTDNKDQESRGFLSDVSISLPHDEGYAYQLTVNAAYSTQTEADIFLGERVTYDAITAGFEFSYALTERTGIRLSPQYSKRSYEGALVEPESASFRADLTYKLSQELKTYVGYRYRSTTEGGEYDDQMVSAGIGGEITERVNGNIEAGYQNRKGTFENSDFDEGNVFFGTNVSWAMSDSTNVGIHLTQDYDVTPTGQSADEFSAGATVTYHYDDRWSSNVGAGYSIVNYEGEDGGGAREDKGYTLTAGVKYSLNERVSAEAGMEYWDRTSNEDQGTFDRLRAGMSMSISF